MLHCSRPLISPVKGAVEDWDPTWHSCLQCAPEEKEKKKEEVVVTRVIQVVVAEVVLLKVRVVPAGMEEGARRRG